MATIQDLADLVGSKLFQAKVQYYMTKAAVAVMAEAYGGTGQPTADEHLKRTDYAKKILSGEINITEYCRAVTTNSTITQKFLANQEFQSDLEYVVNSLYDAFAGIDKGVNQGA